MPEVAPVMSTTLPSNLRREKFAVAGLFGGCEFVAQATRDPANPATVIPSGDRRPTLLSFLSGKEFVSSRFINSLSYLRRPMLILRVHARHCWRQSVNRIHLNRCRCVSLVRRSPMWRVPSARAGQRRQQVSERRDELAIVLAVLATPAAGRARGKRTQAWKLVPTGELR